MLSRTANVDATFLGGDGRFAAVIPAGSETATGIRVEVWNVAEQRLVHSVPTLLPNGNEPVMSPNGELVAMNTSPALSTIISAARVELLDLQTGRERVIASENTCPAGWRGFAFSPSSELLAAGTFCGTGISVWNVAPGVSFPAR